MSRPLSAMASLAPYRAHRLLKQNGLTQPELARRIEAEIRKRGGTQTFAVPTFNVILTRRKWPFHVEAQLIMDVVEAAMREKHVPEADIADAWFADDAPEDPGPPVGRKPSNPARFQPTQKPDDGFTLPESEMLSAAAREYFHITRHPFKDDVQGPADVFLAKDQRYVRDSMYLAAKHGGLLAVVGESGSGKTTLRKDLLDRLKRDSEPLIIIQPKTLDKRKLTTEHICDAVVADLSNEQPKSKLEARARQVERILTDSSKAGNSHCLLIEEAHDLTNPMLKYLKRFWELEDGFRRLISIVLIGQPELATKLDERRNPDLREFIRRCEIATLKSLNGNLEEYLAMKFRRVGLDATAIIDKPAYDAIRARLTRKRQGTAEVESQLYPLVVQNLLVKCMNQAAELGLPKINADLVGRV